MFCFNFKFGAVQKRAFLSFPSFYFFSLLFIFYHGTAPARADALQQSLRGKRQVGSEKLRKTIFTWNKPSLDKSPPEKRGEKRQEKG